MNNPLKDSLTIQVSEEEVNRPDFDLANYLSRILINKLFKKALGLQILQHQITGNMEKTKDSVKELMRRNYENACNHYLAELLRMWELDGRYGFWVSDEPGTIYCYGDTHNLNMEDIIFIVENDIEEDEVLAWEDYCLDAHEFGFSLPNLQSWHKGCPRTPQEVFDRLRALKANLAEAVEEEKQRTKQNTD